MLHQIKCLTAIQLCNLCGLNVVRYGRDTKKRIRFIGMGVLYILLMVLLWMYLGMFTIGMIRLGVGKVVPFYLYMMVSLVILCFSFFKAASVIFQQNPYELQMSLPVSKAAIVSSRFLTMYVIDLLVCLAVVLPVGILYAVMMKPGISFYLWGLIGIVLLPSIPLAAATAAGAAIYAVSARMRHKNLISIGLSMLLVLGIMFGNFSLIGHQESLEQVDISLMRNLAVMLIEQIGHIYPPAKWFGTSVTEGNAFSGMMLAAVSVLFAVILLAVLQKYFVAICSSLNATIAKKNYKMGNLNTSSVLKALWKRELRRYFASSIYVLNTMIGYVLLVMAAVAFWIIGEEKMLQMLGLPFQIELIPILPFALTLIGNMMPMAACSISMEGKQWWIAKTLPITMKQVLDGKIAANLSIAIPFFAVAEVFVFLAVRPTLSEGIWLILIPLVYTMFLSVAGLSINLAVPLMEWESEVRVVKQSASMMLELLLGFVSALIPIGLILLKKADETVVNLGTVAVLVILTAVLYKRNQNVVL